MRVLCGFLALALLGAQTVQLPVTGGIVTFPFAAERLSNKNQANGYPGLDANARLKFSILTGVPLFLTLQTLPPYPSRLGALTNDSGFLTLQTLPAYPIKLSQLANDPGYVTRSQLPPPIPGPIGPAGALNPIAQNLQGVGPFRMVANLDPTMQVQNCGVGASISGSDSAGIVTVGAGDPTDPTGGVSSCTIPFSVAFVNAPVCTANDNSNPYALKPSATAMALTISVQGAFSGDTLSYICIGR